MQRHHSVLGSWTENKEASQQSTHVHLCSLSVDVMWPCPMGFLTISIMWFASSRSNHHEFHYHNGLAINQWATVNLPFLRCFCQSNKKIEYSWKVQAPSTAQDIVCSNLVWTGLIEKHSVFYKQCSYSLSNSSSLPERWTPDLQES